MTDAEIRAEHPDYVTITHGMRGSFCVWLTWNQDGGFYEPVNTGFVSAANCTDPRLVAEGKSWAKDLGVEFRP